MKKVFISLLMVAVIMSMFVSAIADTYTLEEILPSISALSDEDLATLIENATMEQAEREAKIEEETIEEEPAKDDTPITEREDYIDRTPVQRGDKGEDAKVVQEKMIELGFLQGNADGDFGQKSEAAIKLFQKANGLEETGIADSITQYVMYSDMVINKEAYDKMPIEIGDGWEKIKEYYYKYNSSNYYYIFVLKNTSGYNARININIVFYDEENNMIGVAKGSQENCENGYETLWIFSNDMEFDHVSTDIQMEEETSYKDGSQSSIEVSADIIGKKVLISAKNKGKDPVEYVEYHVLFLNDHGEIVGTGWGYIDDSDDEIKPGSIEMRESSCSKNFTDVVVYAHGRIRK